MKVLKCFISEKDIYETEQEIEYLKVIQELENEEQKVILIQELENEEQNEN